MLLLLSIGISLTIHGAKTCSINVRKVGMCSCFSNPVSNLPRCEYAIDYGAVFVVGLVVVAAVIVSSAMSRRRAAVSTAYTVGQNIWKAASWSNALIHV